MRRNERLRYIDRTSGRNPRTAQVVYAGIVIEKCKSCLGTSEHSPRADALEMLASGECPE